MSTEAKVAREVAEAEFEKWVKAMGLSRKLDPDKLDDEDRKDLAKNRGTILDAIEDGPLVVNEEGEFEYTPQIGVGDSKDRTPVRFYEPDGACLMQMDQAKQDALVHREFKLLAAVTKRTSNYFAKMKNRDLDICKAILVTFLVKS